MTGVLTLHTLDFNPEHLPRGGVVKTFCYKTIVNFIMVKLIKWI